MRLLLITLVSLFLCGAVSAPAMARSHASAGVLTCPDGCGMGLTRRRDAGHPHRVQFQGRVLYCCGRCNFAKAVRRVAAGRTHGLRCPDNCGMDMTAHRDRRHPMAVHFGRRTMYCCGTCSFSRNARRLAIRQL